MNRKMLARLRGKAVQLFPTPRRRTEDGVELQQLLDRWQVEDVSADRLRLHNERTGHVINLGRDHVYEYRTGLHGDGTLVLRSQLCLQGNRVHMTPLVGKTGNRPFA